MSNGENFVLPEDVVLQPVDEMAEVTRSQIGGAPGEVAMMRRGSREPARVLSLDSADLINRFRRAQTITEAVIDFSRTHATDPEGTLEEAYPLLKQLVASRMLVPADSEQAKGITATLSRGDRWAGYRIEVALQISEDSEVYRAVGREGESVALKIGRGAAAAGHPFLANEALILGRLRSEVAPRLLSAGVDSGRRYLAVEWRSGVPLTKAATELWNRGAADILDLGGELLAAYGELHRSGVLHGDVHPNNVLVGADGRVTVIDYGMATMIGDAERKTPPRAGVAFFMEPEQARALAAGNAPPPLTAAGEQYAVAAMLYLALTGTHYLDFSLERSEMLRQIANEAPIALAERGRQGFGDVEQVLFRALAKEPDQRFVDLAEMRVALAECAREQRTTPGRKSRASHRPDPGVELVTAYGADGRAVAEPPSCCSVHHGTAGIAYGLLRAAISRSDARLLSLANAWMAKASAGEGQDSAFHIEDAGATSEVIGLVSPAHAEPGLHCVKALLAQANGEEGAHSRAVAKFLELSQRPCENLDLTLGRSGTVLACALLLESGRGSAADRGAIRSLGTKTATSIWDQASGLPPVDSPDGLGNLAMAHGWAGLIYAALRWRAIAPETVELPVEQRLSELAACAEPFGRGLCWRTLAVEPHQQSQYFGGWCNGSAGFVHLWTLAHHQDPTGPWLDLARGAAWSTWESETLNDTICCGQAGAAYACLNLYRSTGEEEWLDRARMLARQAIDSPPIDRPQGEHSLYQGRLGVMLTALELEGDPAGARMPFFESEGWPRPVETPTRGCDQPQQRSDLCPKP